MLNTKVKKYKDNGIVEGRVFRLSHKFTLAPSAYHTIQFTALTDFCLRKQDISVSQGEIDFNAVINPTSITTAFTNTLTTVGLNRLDRRPTNFVSTITLSDDGQISNDGNVAETVTVKSAGGNSNATTIQRLEDYRYLPAGTYYLKFFNGGNQDAKVVYTLIYEQLDYNIDPTI